MYIYIILYWYIIYMYVCVYIYYIYKEIYYKELAHAIMETEKSHDLQLASWRPRTASGVVPVWVYVWRQEKTNVPPWRQRGSLSPALLSYSGLHLIGQGPPTLRWAISFTQSTNSNINLIQKHPHRHTQNNIWPNTWSSWHIKSTIALVL